MPCVSIRHIWSGRASYKTYYLSKKTTQKASGQSQVLPVATTQIARSVANATQTRSRASKIVETSIKIPHDSKLSHQTTFFDNETLRPAKQKTKKVQRRSRNAQHIVSRFEDYEPYLMRDPAEVVRAFHASKHLTRADLINAESCLGSILFGPVPAGHRREFFHDRENIWIWHESWHDEQHRHRQQTVRYEVRTSGVYKKISAGNYRKLEGVELENFRRATHAYLKMIKTYLYNHPKAKI